MTIATDRLALKDGQSARAIATSESAMGGFRSTWRFWLRSETPRSERFAATRRPSLESRCCPWTRSSMGLRTRKQISFPIDEPFAAKSVGIANGGGTRQNHHPERVEWPP